MVHATADLIILNSGGIAETQCHTCKACSLLPVRASDRHFVTNNRRPKHYGMDDAKPGPWLSNNDHGFRT